MTAGAIITAELRSKLGVLIPAALVAAGLAAGTAQVLVFRELLVSCQGNEVTMGIMLAAWLLWGALGALWGGAGRRRAELSAAVQGVAVLAFGVGVALVAALFAARGFSFFLAVKMPGLGAGWLAQLLALEPGQMLSLPQILVLGFAATLLPAIVDGAQFGAACAAYIHLRSADADSVSRVYALDAVGHLLGGTALAWLALQAIPPFAMATAVGLVNVIVGLLLLAASPARRRTLGWALAGLVTIILLASGIRGEKLSHALLWFRHELLASTRTVYGDLALTRFGEDGVYIYNNGLPTASSPAPESLTVDIDFALLQHPAPRRILMIGGGATGGLAAVLRHNPNSIDYLELEPAIFSFVAPWLAPTDREALRDSRVRTVSGDARLFVKRQIARDSGARYDAVLMLLPPPASAQLNRFYTRQWFQQVSQLLSSEGVLAWQIPSSTVYLHGPLRDLNATIMESTRELLPALVCLPGEEMTVVEAYDSDYLTQDAATLLKRAQERGLESNMLYYCLPDMLRPEFTDYVRDIMYATRDVTLNSDERPLAYFYHQAWWLEHRHPGWGERLSRLAQRPAWQWFAAVAGLLLLWALTSLSRPGRKTVIPVSVGIAGLCGMAGEMVLLLNFQSYYGYVFQQIGFLVGSFMVGLAVGSWLLGRWLQREPAAASAGRWLAAILAGGAVFLALMPHLLTALWASAAAPWSEALVAHLVFPTLAAVFGLWVGAQFPLAAYLWSASSQDQVRSASVLYAADLIGAAGGALVAGALLVPILGTLGTCALAALPALVAALLVLRSTSAEGS